MMDQFLAERLELCLERLRQIPQEKTVPAPFDVFFRKEAEFLLFVLVLYREQLKTEPPEKSLEELQNRNRLLYEELLPENYETCYGNPAYAAKRLGPDYGPLFSVLYAQLRTLIACAYSDRRWELTVGLELFLECYVAFEDPETPAAKVLKQILSSYYYDYCADFTKIDIALRLDPAMDFTGRMILSSDLSDLRFLYRFGEYVSDTACGTAGYLNTLPDETIDAMAFELTEGVGKDVSASEEKAGMSGIIRLVCPVGLERVAKSALLQFRKKGIQCVVFRPDAFRIFSADHRNDDALWLDERYVTRRLAATREALESRKALCSRHAGTVCLESTRETPPVFSKKDTVLSLTGAQKALRDRLKTESAQLAERYLNRDGRECIHVVHPVRVP